MNWTSTIRFSLATLLAVVLMALSEPSLGEPVATTREAQLFSAIEAGNAARVSELLEQHPQLIRARRDGMSVVGAALFMRRNGFLFTPPDQNPVLAAVLAKKPVLDLFEASATGSIGRMRELLGKHPSRARAWDARGWMALHMAAFGGSAPALELLLQHGADVHARTNTSFRLTPLLAAMLNGQYATAKLLLERGANVHDKQVTGGTALHEAAFICRQDLLELLLSHGAELNARSNDGRTPLSEARRGKCSDIAAWLVTRGARD